MECNWPCGVGIPLNTWLTNFYWIIESAYTQFMKNARRCWRPYPRGPCVLTPDEEEGPFYIPQNLVRRDIVEYRPGIPMRLFLVVTNARTCQPLPDYWVSIWQVDALGYYSGYLKWDPTKPSAPDRNHFPETDSSTFLRGLQKTDQSGTVQFNTVMPGWYYQRTRHIHVKIFAPNMREVFTTQLYFTERNGDRVYRVFPYYSQPRLCNWCDWVFTHENGDQTLIHDVTQVNSGNIEEGLVARMNIGLASGNKSLQNN